MAPESNDGQENDSCPTNGVVVGQQATAEVIDDKGKTLKHPRWTRQETLVLIEGKQVAENRGKKGHRSSSVLGTDQLEPKWDVVSSFCRKHGVNRGPDQCRKRLSNLVCDFRKIKAWESQVKEKAESFWLMRNDLRREKKLPGFFDWDIYGVLDRRGFIEPAHPPTLATITADAKDGNGVEVVVGEEEEEEEDAKAILKKQKPVAKQDGLFLDVQLLAEEGNGSSLEKQAGCADTPTDTVPAPIPISGRLCQPFCQPCCNQGMTKRKQPCLDFWRVSMSQEGWKRRRLSLDAYGDANLEERSIKALEKNNSMLNAQLEVQNVNQQLDRELWKDQNDSLVAALSKITDALGRIADKL